MSRGISLVRGVSREVGNRSKVWIVESVETYPEYSNEQLPDVDVAENTADILLEDQADPTPEEAADSTPEEAADPTPEKAADPTPEKAADPTPEEAADLTSEETADPMPEETPEPSTEEEPVNTATITFWPGEGGELSITQKTVQIGEPFGELPVPSKDDYVFEGWFKGIDSGEQVTELSICQKNTDLYAHWKRRVSLDDAEDFEITGIFNQQYSGNYVILAPVLKLDGTILQRDGDYTVSYSNNLEPGTAQITFTGIGYYKGSVSRTFRILLPTPGLPVLSNIAGGVKISWTSVNHAAKYRVLRKNASGVWTKVADTTALSYTDKSVKSGTQYAYSICCMSTDSSQATSSYNKTGRTIRYIATPHAANNG